MPTSIFGITIQFNMIGNAAVHDISVIPKEFGPEFELIFTLSKNIFTLKIRVILLY